MRKRQKKDVLILLVFMALLCGAAVAGASDCRYFGHVKEAMRAVRRLNNLHYMYIGNVTDNSSSQISKVEVWADQLTGGWQADYSMVDEDGEWPYLRRYCDGKQVYEDMNWDGEFDMNIGEGLEIPQIDELTILPYNMKDVASEVMEQEDGYTVISHVFTTDYTTQLLQESQEQLQNMWQRRAANMDGTTNVAFDQYQQTRVAEAKVTYWLDREKVLRRKKMTMTLQRPHVEPKADGQLALGDNEKIYMTTSVEVLAYNYNRSITE